MGPGLHSSKLLCCSTYCLFCVVLCIVCVCVCVCVLYYCHRVATQLQLTNIHKLMKITQGFCSKEYIRTVQYGSV